MLITPVVGIPFDAEILQHRYPFRRASLLGIEGNDAPGHQVLAGKEAILVSTVVSRGLRGEFVNMVLAWGLASGAIALEELRFDGVAGSHFYKALAHATMAFERNDLITMALQLGAPVEGLEADGTFGEKWAEVVALCKGGDEAPMFDPVATEM